MQAAVEFALAHGWPDQAVDALVRCLTDRKMEAAFTLVRIQDMPEPAATEMQELIALAVA